MTNKSKKILSEISGGELLDKISILEIKLKKIKTKSFNREILKEYKILKEIQKKSINSSGKITKLYKSIKKVNLKLWEVEDKLRIAERNKKFGKKFIMLARAVYFNNDKRSKLKLEMNKFLGSNIREIKKYAKY